MKYYRNVPHFLADRIARSFRGEPPASLGIIGGGSGPTAVFVAKARKPRLDRGELEVRPAARPLFAAVALSLTLAFLATVLVAALDHLSGRRR